MSTYRYRGDLKTTGDQLRLRDGGSEQNKKPVEIKAEGNDTELILSSPKNTSLAGMDEDAAGKKIDEIVGVKATQTLQNKSIDADNNTISELELDNLKDGVLIDSVELVELETDNLGDSTGNHIPADADDTMLLSALAIKTYVDARDAEQDEAIETTFNPDNSDLTDTNVQDAIDTLANSEVTGDELSTTGGGNLTANRVITLRDNPIIPGSEYVKIPAGDTSSRPDPASQAMMRYNTDTDQIEKYDGTEWAQVGGGGLEVVLASTDISPAEVSTHYLVDTSSSARIITLPDSTSLSSADTKKAVVRITDIGENSETNNITINASGSDVIKMDGVAAASQLIFDVNGTWIQLALNGTTWYVDDVFWNNISDDTVTSVYLGANYYNKSELNGGQLDNRYYTETEIDNKLSLKYDASNPAGYETPSQLNTRDTNNRARANHTGTQLANTISDFSTAVAANSAVAANTAKVSADGSIDTHSDVDTTTIAPAAGQALVWNGTNWVPGSSGLEIKSPAAGTISASISSHYVLDTSSGAYTITLPDSASLSSGETKGAVIRIVDSGNNADVNNIVINASGSDDILLGKSYDSGSIIIDNTLTFDVPGTWIQLVLSGSRWVVEGVFI